MIPWTLLSVALGAASVHVDPSVVTLGSRGGAELRVDVPASEGPAQIELSTNVGSFSRIEPLGPGHFRARFHPPQARFPQVALVLVTVHHGAQAERHWVSIPLQANAVLKVKTKKFAEVEADVGDLHVGPFKANRSGNVSFAVRVPPGVDTAEIHSRDAAGNVSEKRIPLSVQPFDQLRIVALGDGASWTDAHPLPISVFAVTPSGAPLDSPGPLHAEAQQGHLERPTRADDGSFVFPYRAPEHLTAPEDALTFSVAGSRPVAVSVPVRPGPAAALSVHLHPAAYRAGTHARILVAVRAEDGKGNPVPSDAVELTASMGQVTRQRDGTFVLEVPDAFDGNQALTLHAKAGALAKDATLALEPEGAARAELSFDHGYVRAGDAVEGTLALADRFGNPASAEGVSVISASGRRAKLTRVRPGVFHVRYEPAEGELTGPLMFRVERHDAELARSEPLPVVGERRAWEPSASLALGAQSNLSLAKGLVPRVGLALRFGRSSFEALAEADWRFYGGFDAVQDGLTEHGSMHGFSVGLGVRYTRPLSLRWSMLGTALLGATRVRSELTGTGPLATITGSEIKTAGMLRLGGGLTYRTSAGLWFGQLTLEQSSAQGQLSGNLGGVGLSLGFIRPF